MNYNILYEELEKAHIVNWMTPTEKLFAQASFEGYVKGLDQSILELRMEKEYKRADYLEDNYEKILKKNIRNSIIPKYREKAIKRMNKKGLFSRLFG